MKLRHLANVVRNEPLPNLIGEAGWRGIRSVRRSIFRLKDLGGDCPVLFHPIGYYRLQRDFFSERSRQAVLAYADAIRRGEYPLMGYGAPHLGVNPDWQCDWVSGKSWPSRRLGKDANRAPRRIGREGPLGALALAIRAGGG